MLALSECAFFLCDCCVYSLSILALFGAVLLSVTMNGALNDNLAQALGPLFYLPF